MIKTLRITSIIAAITAAILLVCAVVFGMRSDPKTESYLKKPGAFEKFAADRGQGPARNENQDSPLVKAAVDFARYLNPPPPPVMPGAATAAVPTRATPAPQNPVSAKFDLIGTSFFADKPELSLALIDEPGQGLHWVRQGSSVGRLLIEKVGDGSITVRDGERQFDMSITVRELWRDLVKGAGSSGDVREDSETGRISSSPTRQPLPPVPVSAEAASIPARRSIPPRRSRDTVTKVPTASGRLPSEAYRAPKITPGVPGLPDEAESVADISLPRGPTIAESTASVKDVLRQRLADKTITPEEAKRIEELTRNLEQIEAAESAAREQVSESE